jgi:hypothetical protein
MLGMLIPLGGGDPIPLLKPSLIVGRRPSCDIHLDFANVSSHHCRLEYINGYWRAADISRNGTKVNGERIDEKFLQPGDTVAFARHAFEIQYTPDPEGVPPAEEADPFSISLLEKAGLLHHKSRDRSSARNRPNASGKPSPRPGESSKPPSAPKSGSEPLDDDDQALEWLKG